MNAYFRKLALTRVLSLLFLLFNLSISYGQVPGVIRCHTMHMDSLRHAENPDLQSNQEFENWIEKVIMDKEIKAQSALIIGEVYQIPVIVHVIHNGEAVGTGTNISAAAIQSQMDVLNEDFRKLFGTPGWNTHPEGADTKIEFCLAKRRPDGTAFPPGEDGINRVNRNTQGWGAPPYTTAFIDGTIKPWSTGVDLGGWDAADYMNFWSVNISGGILGYAQFPTTALGGMGCGAQNVNTDGVVMLYSSIGKSAVTGFPGPYNEGRTATHEIGHWLGLRHIWGDGGCGVDDYCADTPLSDASNFGCPNTNSCVDPNGDPVDMVENYMDYTDDLCMNIFTYDQMARMRTVLENSPIRASLITSDACIPPAVSDASIINITSPGGDNCPGSIIPNVTIKNRGSSTLTSATIDYTIDGGAATTFNWTGSVAPGAQTNVALPAFTSTLGVHTIKAYSLLPNGVTDPDPTYDTTELQFAVSNGYQPNFVEDFEAGQFVPDVRWNIVNVNGDCMEWMAQSGTSSSGTFPNDAACVPFYSNNGAAQEEYLYTPFFILPCNASSAEVVFDKAYRRRTNGSSDRLRLEMSLDCGATWGTTLFDAQGNGLSTGGNSNSYWIPSVAGDWDNIVVDLTAYVTGASQNVQFRFRGTNTGNQGGNIYVDNFEFNAVTPGEIEVSATGSNVLDEGYYDFGSQPIGGPTTVVFTIDNPGSSALVLTGPISIIGDAEYTLNTTFGTTTVPAGGSTTFSVDFTPTGAGPYSAVLSFGTNDCDEGTYNFELTGSGNVTPPTASFTASPTTICEGATVTYTDASLGASTWAWTFPGGAPASATGVGPHVVTYSTVGNFDAQLDVTNAFGSDTDLQSGLITVLSGTGAALPITEGFVGVTFPPVNWSINNGGIPDTWVRDGANGNAPTAGNSAVMDNFTNNNSGNEDDLVMPPADFTGLVSAQLQFDVAYARYNATYNDQLQVLVSNDCGQTFTIEYDKASTVLATDPDQTAAYTNPGTWRQETIDLSAYVGNGKVEIMFKNIGGWGQFLYLDNINLTGVASAEVASFIASPSTICEGETVTFTDASTGATSWVWDFGVGASPATATGAGPHVVTYSTAGSPNITLDINGGADTDVQSITVNATPAAPVVTVTDNCGSSDLTATGTNLLWSTTETTSTITVSTAGTYTVTQTVAGCTSIDGTGVANPLTIPTAPTVTVIDNCGSSDLTAIGTNLLWSTGETTATITVTTAGTYTVTETVAGCTSTAGSGVANPIAIPSAPVVTVADNCGSSDLTATGSNLLWSTAETTPTITVTAAGTYAVTQTVGGCTSAPGTGVANPTAIPSVPVVTVTDNCGSSDLTATGVNLLWSTAETTPTITVGTAGSYTVTQTVGGCTSAPGTGVANPTAIPSAPVVTVTDNCGSSDLTATGSNLLWSTGETTPTITVGTAGTYTVTQTVGGCTSTAGSGVANPTAIPSAPLVSVIDNCGSSDLTATGSNLLWSTAETTSTITVGTAGAYTVTQTVSGCTSSPGTGVANPTAIPAAPVVTVTDNCGSSDLTTSGTNLLWSTTETTPTITVGSAGTYTVTQTVGGCTSPAGTGVASPLSGPTITLGAQSDPSACGASDGSIVVNGSGTGDVSWTGPTSSSATGVTLPYTITGLIAGGYNISFVSGGCPSNVLNGSLADPSAPSAPVVTVTDNCGSSDLTATGTNLVWSTAETTSTITVGTAGTYTVTQTVAGCTSATGSGVANPIAVPSAPLVTVTDNCGSSDLTSTGSNLLWSTAETTPTITVGSAGTYTVTQTVGGCTSAPGTGVANPSSSTTITLGTETDPSSCGNTDGSIVVMGSGTGDLVWTGAAPGSAIGVSLPYTISGLGAGSYSISFGYTGCSSNVLNGSLSDPSAPSAPIVTVADNCGSSDLTATGSNLVWSTGETTPTITVSTAGTYTVTQTVGGCTSSAGSGVANPTSVPSAPVVTVVDNCGTSDLSATGSNLLWSTAETSPTITVGTAGTYMVTQTVSGCTSAPGTGITNPTAIPSAPLVTVMDNCGTSDLTATGSNLLWSTGETTPTITVGSAGTYTVSQTVAGCTSPLGTGVANPLSAPLAPVVTANGSTTICAGSSVDFTSSEPTGIVWSTTETNQTITVTASGSYSVTYTGANGCSSTSTPIVVTVAATPVTPTINPTGPLIICSGETVDLTASVATGITWSTSETTQTIAVGSTGTYTVTYTDGNGCSATSLPTVVTEIVPPAAPVITSSAPGICAGGSVDLTSSYVSGNDWSTSETTQTITVSVAGLYSVTYTDGNGCSSTSSPIDIIVNPLPTVTLSSFADVCLQDASFSLSGGLPAGGTYSGPGVTGGIFDPASAGVGVHTLTYTYTDANGCTNTAQADIRVDDCTGITNLSDVGLSVYPNPTTSILNVSSNSEALDYVVVYDGAGRIVTRIELSNANSIINLSDYAPGVYNLEIHTMDNIYRTRIVKQ